MHRVAKPGPYDTSLIRCNKAYGSSVGHTSLVLVKRRAVSSRKLKSNWIGCKTEQLRMVRGRISLRVTYNNRATIPRLTTYVKQKISCLWRLPSRVNISRCRQHDSDFDGGNEKGSGMKVCHLLETKTDAQDNWLDGEE